MKGEIDIIMIAPGREPRIETIPNELESFQGIVEGYIEVVPFPLKDALLICNEEGKLLGFPHNFYLGADMIVGTAIICGQDGEEFDDVPFSLEELRRRWPSLWAGMSV